MTDAPLRDRSHEPLALLPYGTLIPYETFLKSYEVIHVSGDGHCFLYAIVSSNTSTLLLTPGKILKALESYINTEKESIFNFAGCSNSVDLITCFLKYRDEKMYNNLFGDSIPFLIAKALDINITILEICVPNVRQTLLNHDASSSINIEVLRSDRSQHYSALRNISQSIIVSCNQNRVSLLCVANSSPVCILVGQNVRGLGDKISE